MKIAKTPEYHVYFNLCINISQCSVVTRNSSKDDHFIFLTISGSSALFC